LPRKGEALYNMIQWRTKMIVRQQFRET
jgi:hypothetical protein